MVGEDGKRKEEGMEGRRKEGWKGMEEGKERGRRRRRRRRKEEEGKEGERCGRGKEGTGGDKRGREIKG